MVTDRTEDGWTKVGKVSSLAEGEIAESFLDSADIPVQLRYDPAGSVILGPGSINPMSGVEIWVPEDRADEAISLLSSFAEEEL